MKKIFNFTKKKKSSPSASDTGSVLSVGYDLKEKDLGKVHKAAFAGDVAKLKQLTKKNDLNQLDKENRTPLHIACVQGHTEVVQFLVENKVKLNLCDNQNRSALMKAVQCQQDRCVSVILDHEADPNLVDINGNTALHLAARIPSLSVALQLLEHEANINAQNKEGNTPLILSVEENHAEMAERLLKEGADVNIKNQERRSALMIAACNGQISMVRLLLQYDADITVKDDKGWSSDDYAVMNGHHACSHLIIEHGTKRKSFQSASHLTVLGSPEAGLSLRGPAPDKDAAGRSFREAGKVTEDNSRADSISRASKSGPADSWPSTDEDDELDLSPKKAQKVNLKKLMSASKKERKDVGVDRDPDKSWSGTESEPNSEGSAVDHPAFTTALHASSTSTQHPATSIPNSFSNLPQKTTPLISSQKEKVSSEDEENEVKDEYDETEGESSEGSDLDEEVEHHQKTETSQDKPRDFMSELGIEKDSEEDSPWDSESGSDSPKKKQQSESKSPTKSHKAISSVCEESNEDLLYIPSFLRGSKHNSVFRTVGWPGGHKAVVLRTSHEKEDDSKAEKPEKQHKPMLRGQSSVLSKMMHSEDAEKKTDLMEEFGLGDVDDLEDASDWDTASTTSRASKALPVYKPEEELADEGPLVLPVVQEQNLDASSTEDQSTDSPKRTELLPRVTLPLPSPRTLTPRISTQLQPQLQPHTSRNLDRPGREEESDWDMDNTSSPLKTTTQLPHHVKTIALTPADDGASDSSFEANEHPDKEREALHASQLYVSSPYGLHLSESQPSDAEEKQKDMAHFSYEKIWVESEKKEAKSQYKNVAAELKERFGEIEQKKHSESESKEAKKAEEENVKKEMERGNECPEVASEEDSSADEDDSIEDKGEPIMRPTIWARNAGMLYIPEQRESGLEESHTEEPGRAPIHTSTVEGSQVDLTRDSLTKDHDVQHSSQEPLNGTTQRTENCTQRSSHAVKPTYESEDKEISILADVCDLGAQFIINQECSTTAGRSPLLFVGGLGVSPPKSEVLFPNTDEEAKERLQGFIAEDVVAKTDVMKGEHKTTALWDTGGSSKQTEVQQGKGKKADTSPGKANPQQDSGSHQRDGGFERSDSLSPRWHTKSQKSTNRTTEEDDVSQRSLRHVPALQQARPPCPVKHQNGDPLSVFDDSTLSEVSEDEGRSPSSRHRKEKSGGELDVADNFEDLTQSSDTATEELDSAMSGFRHAALLIKQLDTSSIDSVSMVKLQNMFHEYERTIQRERGRHSRLSDKVSQLEQERSELRLLLDETRKSKSSLEHLRLELETDLNNFKFLLKQEQEKHQSASMLYDKTREQLRRKEEQCRAEAEERQKVELGMRSLELEMRALLNNLKQLEEDRREAQRLLAHERTGRALQEELLNSHLRRQQDIEEQNLRSLNKSNEVMSQLTEASDRERELQHQLRTLQEELSSARAELECSRSQWQQDEARLAEDKEALRERLEDARRDLKLNEEALAQTVFQYNGQLSALKAECSVVSAKLEHERQTRQQLEAEAEAGRARLQAALQETERCQAARADAERTLQRERDEHQRAQQKWAADASTHRDSIHSLEQKLSRAEAHANGLENEGHHAALAAAEKGALLEAVARERDQAHTRLKEVEAELQSERDRASRAGARQEAMQERLAQAQSEGALLRQQLEEAHSRGMAKEQAASDAQERFTEVLNQLRADGEERVQLVEERSKELAAKNAELREQNYRLEQEKAERESSLRQLQQELADSLKKLSMCEASLEVNTRYRSDLEEEKARTQKDMDRLKGKLQESEELYIQAERRVNNLKGSLDDKERDVINIGQKLQEALAGTANTDQTIKQLEEAMQRLEIENARLEAAAKQQTSRIEVLQKEAQEATVVRHRFEDLVTNLQSSKMTLEDQLSREMQKQNVLSHNAHDSQALWEEELKSRSRIGLRLAELEKQKGELSNQVELEKKKTKKMAEQKKAVDTRLEQEMKRNTELQKEMYRLRTLVKTAKKKLREQAGGELDSPVGSLRVELGHRHSEAEGAITRMKAKVDDLQGQLEREALRCFRQEEVNRELKEQLGALRSLGRSHEQLERSKRQLENEVVALRRQAEAGVMDQSQAEQYRREMEERARQEIRHKLEEVNIFLQTQAASQEALEQMKAANEASQRVHLEQRIRELEGDLSRVRTAQHDSLVQRDSSRTELERYQELYTEELKLRKSLSAKLERSNERLAETNAKLLSERQRSKSILSSGLMNGSLGGLEGASLGSVGAYGSSLGPLNRNLGTSLLGSVGEPQGNHVEAYLAKMQSELEKNISKELDYATTELEGGSARMSPVGSACASQKNLNLNLEQQDPLSKATQQYLEVLKKNYMI
ncbi:ankyrin repeat domain-containing protein 26 isoform X2 [Electrophorus electricus]|uniref:ankyrin repeat domain-containing protein 26 isoform X2 n=1 Tax=Electrophorus electricus TaxID=8005 RepID=UPI0015D0176B|nr:ankyrin repeat domain-containing protein 26 isoform X2 [Electrophorus electricus]